MIGSRWLLSAAALVALSGCEVGPDYHPPETAGLPAAFEEPQARSGGSDVDPATWWQAFGDATLDQLVARALRDSPDIQVAASRVRQARLQETIATARINPTVDATGNVNHTSFSKNAGFSSIASLFGGGGGGGAGAGGGGSGGGIALPGSGITTYSLGFDAEWELDLFGGARRGIEAARANTDAAVWNKRDAAVTLAAEVAQTYFSLRLDQAQAQIIDGELQRQRRALQIAEHISQVGLVAPVDVTRQRASVTTTEARLPPIRADQDLRIHALGILLGVTPEALTAELNRPLPVLAPAPAIPAGLPSDLLRRRPDIRAAERQLAAANAQVGVATADLYPKLSLTGIEQLISTALSSLFERDSLQVTASAAARFPLFDSGRRKATVGLRREDRDQALIQYRVTVLQALRDVEDPLAQIAAERLRNAALRQATADAASTAHATEAQYQSGFVAQDAVLNAQANVLSTREQLATSDAQLRVMTTALFKALGGGWQTAEPDTAGEAATNTIAPQP